MSTMRVLLDAAGVNLAMVRLYARALPGQRAYGTRPQHRGKNVRMIGAIGLPGVITKSELTRGNRWTDLLSLYCPKINSPVVIGGLCGLG